MRRIAISGLLILSAWSGSTALAQPYPLATLTGNWLYIAHQPVMGPEGQLVFLMVEEAYLLQEMYEEGHITLAERDSGGVYPRLMFGFARAEGGREAIREYRGEWLEEEGIVRMEQDGSVAYYRPVLEGKEWLLYALDPQFGGQEDFPRFRKVVTEE